MINEIAMAVIQAATEFLPVSSSGHLALFGNILGKQNLFFVTLLHVASLLAVLIFVRRELVYLLKFNRDSNRLLVYLILATIPAVVVGLLFSDFIEGMFSSYLFLGLAFFFTGCVLLLTKIKVRAKKISYLSAIIIGLFQALALFPGVSRSGMTISSASFLGIEKSKAAKFSFLLFIPLVIGAVILNFGDAYFNASLAVAFLVCFVLSLVFLNLLYLIIRRGNFWMFSFYCFFMSVISLILYLN